MSTRSIFRRMSWTIAADTSPGASGPLRSIECTTCAAESPTTGVRDQMATDTWAVRHAATTGHTGYREIVTAFLRATPTTHTPHREEKQA